MRKKKATMVSPDFFLLHVSIDARNTMEKVTVTGFNKEIFLNRVTRGNTVKKKTSEWDVRVCVHASLAEFHQLKVTKDFMPPLCFSFTTRFERFLSNLFLPIVFSREWISASCIQFREYNQSATLKVPPTHTQEHRSLFWKV